MKEMAAPRRVTVQRLKKVRGREEVRREGKRRTERLLLPQDANDNATLDDKVDERSGGGPDDRQDEQPDRVERFGRGGLEVVGDLETGVSGDVARSDGEDDAEGDHGLRDGVAEDGRGAIERKGDEGRMRWEAESVQEGRIREESNVRREI
jgi:hypothetical protein